MEQIKEWLLNCYFKIIDAVKKKKEDKYLGIINTVLAIINDNFADQNLTTEVISSTVNLSPNYLRAIFKENRGIPLSTYINNVRFEKAQQYLIHTDLHANQIAEQVGLTKSGYFYTAFKKVTGMTPDEYRRIHRKTEL